jgi:tRNA(Ile)-lysidine synthase
MTFQIEENTTEISHPIPLTFNEVDEIAMQHKNTIYISKEYLQFPLTLRKWQKGDSFYPAGMQGKKKLSKYFKDEKLSLLEKEHIWLLCDCQNNILWLVGKRQDNRFLKTTNHSKNIKISLV